MLKLEQFNVSHERGFLPLNKIEPKKILKKHKSFGPWAEVAADLDYLIPENKIRKTVNELPEIKVPNVKGDKESNPELRYLMLILSYIGHAYVLGEAKTVQKIPANLAAPWVKVAGMLGRPPILSYSSYALDNWTLKEPGKIAIGNIRLLQNFLGGVDENWFILIHIGIEALAGHIMNAAAHVYSHRERENTITMEEGAHIRMLQVSLGIKSMLDVLKRMPESCEPHTYYHRVRPYIHGWKNNPDMPDGLIYEGEYDNKPQFFRGETGAQSVIVPVLDAFLGISHENDLLRDYLDEMREYMPPKHRAFLEEIERLGPVRDFCAEIGGKTAKQFNDCVQNLQDFRTQHLEYAASYIHKQSQTKKNSTAVGTGGTPFMKYLKKHRDETEKHLIKLS